jgi:creatinine amidohydrolase/Fe(II)-dependent formamide hydrolase-like protein
MIDTGGAAARQSAVPGRAHRVDGDPTRTSAERGRVLLERKVKAAVRQIQQASPSR